MNIKLRQFLWNVMFIGVYLWLPFEVRDAA
jgi:hypothetical protein